MSGVAIYPNLDQVLTRGNTTGSNDITFSNGQALKTTQTADDTFLIQAWNGGTLTWDTYMTLQTTADGSSCDLKTTVTMGGQPIIYGNSPSVGSLTIFNGGSLKTSTSSGNTLALQAYDVDGGYYTTFANLTAGNTPTFNIAAATTIGSFLAPTGGTYTPTHTAVTNINTFGTVSDLTWSRSANMGFVSGRISIRTTAAGAAEFRTSLPFSSHFSLFTDAGGSVISGIGTSCMVRAETTNKQLSVIFVSPDTTARDYAINASFKII